MASNNNIQITNLDFDSIKTNLKTFLRSQDKFKDYDFEGSGLSVLMDLLAYNTHYNAYYLNMIANEMFLDTSTMRSSAVSHAKLLNYTPQSASAPVATIRLVSSGISASSLTLPKYTKFQSEAIDGTNYPFVAKNLTTVNTVSGVATFNDLEILQGEPISLSFTYNSATNSKSLFVLPDSNIDTSTLIVQVQNSTIDTNFTPYTLAQDVAGLNGTSTVFFLQEGLSGNYEIYFGEGVLGKPLVDGNVINISYLVTSGSSSYGANNFVLMDSLGAGNNIIYPITSSSNGKEKETIDSIKFNAPKSYSAQGRAVTKEDYITILQNNNLGYVFDAINVWGGADNDPPVYGQVFISAKPSGGYSLTQTQKEKLINSVIKPVSVLTVKPVLLDPDYTYLIINADVVYDQRRTNLTSTQLKAVIKESVLTYARNSLNTFNSTFSLGDLINYIQNSDVSVISNNCNVFVEKKFFPIIGTTKSYTLNYGVALERSVYSSGVTGSPSLQVYKESTLLNDVFIEEVPFATSGIDTIDILNPGFSYSRTPTVVIEGDGIGAEATAVVVNGRLSKIVVTNAGTNYTQAVVTIQNASDDTTGTSGSAYAKIAGQYGQLRTYYYDSTNNNAKTVLNSNIATIDYLNGTITFPDFSPQQINNSLGQLSIIANPASKIIASSQNRIVTIDEFDDLAININIIAK